MGAQPRAHQWEEAPELVLPTSGLSALSQKVALGPALESIPLEPHSAFPSEEGASEMAQALTSRNLGS